MNSICTGDEPPERSARLNEGRAVMELESAAHPEDPEWLSMLEAWLRAYRTLERWPVSALARAKLQDGHRICEELKRVLEGKEHGEGSVRDRTLQIANAGGQVQAVASMFACPQGTFIELLVTAPWNLLGSSDPHDVRTRRGAGTALIGRAIDWSRRRGCQGRVALQAENTRALQFYEHLGFARIEPTDSPLAIVPTGDEGTWSPEILRVAAGRPSIEEERSPWLLFDPARHSHTANRHQDDGAHERAPQELLRALPG